MINEIAMHKIQTAQYFRQYNVYQKSQTNKNFLVGKKAVKSIKQASGEPKQKQRPGNYVKFAELLM